MSKIYLVADIGGTSSRYALFEHTSKLELIKKESTWLKTAEFSDFQTQLEELKITSFVTDFSKLEAMVIAGAGPSRGKNFVSLTQVPWNIELEKLEKEFQVKKSRAINDFAAQALSCLSPIRAEADLILQGEDLPNSSIGVIGAGTGLGVAALIPDGAENFIALASEGGHINYAPETEKEFDFLKFVAKEMNVPYPSLEDTLSGRGLTLSHKFLTSEELTPEEVSRKLSRHPETVALFATNYGRACRNVALQFISTGGLFIAGGIAAKNRILINDPSFEKAFRGTRQHKDLLAKISVRLLDNQESGLWGCCYLASRL